MKGEDVEGRDVVEVVVDGVEVGDVGSLVDVVTGLSVDDIILITEKNETMAWHVLCHDV